MRLVRRTTALAAVAAVGGIIGGFDTVAAADIPLAVDCIESADTVIRVFIDFGDQLVITPTNCDGAQIRNAADIDTFDGVPGATVIGEPGGEVDLNATGMDEVQVDIFAVYPATVPAGELLLTADAVIAADPLVFDVGDGDEGEHQLGGDPLCDLIQLPGPDADHVYGTVEITISQAGAYTFRNTTTDPLGKFEGGLEHPMQDPFLVLYSAFDPANPDDGIVGCNDDLNDLFDYGVLYDDGRVAENMDDGSLMEGHRPYFTADLEPGVYTLVLTTWHAVTYEMWTSGDTSAATATFEMWGPADSMCLSSDSACVESQNPALPATGSSTRTSALLATMALLVGGGLVLGGRRRVRQETATF